jgi:hypothetical protein
MAFKELLIHTIDVKSISGYDDSNQPIYSIAASGIPARIEWSQKLVKDKLGRDEVASALVFIDYGDIANIEPDYIIAYNSREYRVISVDLLPDGSGFHHWEVYIK